MQRAGKERGRDEWEAGPMFEQINYSVPKVKRDRACSKQSCYGFIYVVFSIFTENRGVRWPLYLRAEEGKVTLSWGSAVEVVEVPRFLDQVAGNMVEVSIGLGFFQYLPCLLLEESHLFGNHLKLVADVGMDKRVCLRWGAKVVSVS